MRTQAVGVIGSQLCLANSTQPSQHLGTGRAGSGEYHRVAPFEVTGEQVGEVSILEASCSRGNRTEP
jgi:hypothetical protein